MDKVQMAAASMAAAYDADPYVRGWLEGYAARAHQAEEQPKKDQQ